MKYDRLKLLVILTLLISFTLTIAACDMGGDETVEEDYDDDYETAFYDVEGDIQIIGGGDSTVEVGDLDIFIGDDSADINEEEGEWKFTNIEGGNISIELTIDDRHEDEYELAVEAPYDLDDHSEKIVIENLNSNIYDLDIVVVHNDEYDNYTDDDNILLTGEVNDDEVNLQSRAETADENYLEIDQLLLIYRDEIKHGWVDEDGEFEIWLDRENPAGIVFMGREGQNQEKSKYMGHLVLGDDLDSIPSRFIDENRGYIDFGEIVSTAEERWEPENNTIGEELDIDQESVELLKQSGSLFAATIMNEDIINAVQDRDGPQYFDLVLDYEFEEAYLWEWENRNTITFAESIGEVLFEHFDYVGLEYPYFQAHTFSLVSNLDVYANEMNLNYPGEQFVLGAESVGSNSYQFERINALDFRDVMDEYTSYPPAGEYVFDFSGAYNDISMKLTEDFEEEARENSFLAVPRLHVEEDESGLIEVESIAWDYRRKSGEEITRSTVQDILSSEDGVDGIEVEVFYINIDKAREFLDEDKDIHFDHMEMTSDTVETDEYNYILDDLNLKWMTTYDQEEIFSEYDAEDVLAGIRIEYEDLYGISYESWFAHPIIYDHEDIGEVPERPQEEVDEEEVVFQVEDGEGNPVKDATVLLEGAAEKKTDETGVAEFDGLGEGRVYDYFVAAEEIGVKEGSINPEDVSEKEVTLAGWFELELEEEEYKTEQWSPEPVIEVEVKNKSEFSAEQEISLQVVTGDEAAEELKTLNQKIHLDGGETGEVSYEADFNYLGEQELRAVSENYHDKIQMETDGALDKARIEVLYNTEQYAGSGFTDEVENKWGFEFDIINVVEDVEVDYFEFDETASRIGNETVSEDEVELSVEEIDEETYNVEVVIEGQEPETGDVVEFYVVEVINEIRRFRTRPEPKEWGQIKEGPDSKDEAYYEVDIDDVDVLRPGRDFDIEATVQNIGDDVPRDGVGQEDSWPVVMALFEEGEFDEYELYDPWWDYKYFEENADLFLSPPEETLEPGETVEIQDYVDYLWEGILPPIYLEEDRNYELVVATSSTHEIVEVDTDYVQLPELEIIEIATDHGETGVETNYSLKFEVKNGYAEEVVNYIVLNMHYASQDINVDDAELASGSQSIDGNEIYDVEPFDFYDDGTNDTLVLHMTEDDGDDPATITEGIYELEFTGIENPDINEFEAYLSLRWSGGYAVGEAIDSQVINIED